MFITLEGVEGSGKTTLAQTAYQHLTGISGFPEVVLTREPGGTRLGELIRELLLHGPAMDARAELLLYAAGRARHVSHVIRPALSRGAVVLCDRFTDSTVAYQGYGRGLDMADILQCNRLATGGLVPDLTIWLRLPVEQALARLPGRGRECDRIESALLDFHQRVERGYEVLAEADPLRIVPVDAGLPVWDVTKVCVDVIKERMKR